MDRRYINSLLRQAQKNPAILHSQKRFWRMEVWCRYLERCDELLFDDPDAGYRLISVAPSYAIQLNAHGSWHNSADALMQAHSYLASAYRARSLYQPSEASFIAASRFRATASPAVLADHLRRFAYLRICQEDPQCFQLIEEAIGIHKRGNLVHRHPLGECLLCRGHANIVFGHVGRSFDDLTASLNHLSLRVDKKPWYAALNNLLYCAVEHGTQDQLRLAYENLKPAVTLLNTHRARRLAKLRLRWLMALFESRIGNTARAAVVFGDLRIKFAEAGRLYEYASISADLAANYLHRGLNLQAIELAERTASFLKEQGVPPEDLLPWSPGGITRENLIKARTIFLDRAQSFGETAA